MWDQVMKWKDQMLKDVEPLKVPKKNPESASAVVDKNVKRNDSREVQSEELEKWWSEMGELGEMGHTSATREASESKPKIKKIKNLSQKVKVIELSQQKKKQNYSMRT